MFKKMLSLFIVLLILSLPLIPTMNSRTTDKKPSTMLDDSFITPVVYIEAASAYDYGLKVGRQLHVQYQLIDLFTRLTTKNNIIERDIKNEITLINQSHPFFLEELKGLSASTNIRLEKLVFLQKSLHSVLSGECTTTLTTGDATKNNETFLTFNADTFVNNIRNILFSTILHRIFSLKCWIVRINTMRYRYAFWGIPIIYEWPFFNEKGLGWGATGTRLTTNESRYIDEGPGITTMMLERLSMMTCRNVSEVAALWKNTERASQKGNGWFHQWDVSSPVYCDSNGGILAIEQTHNHIVTVFGNSTDITGAPKGILWHANHHQWLDPNLTGSVYPDEYPSSALRAERALELLENHYGNISLDICKRITRDHGGGTNRNRKDSGDICRHPDKNSLKITAFSWIIQPKDYTVYWTHRSPCRSIFWKHDFTHIFGLND